MTSPPPAAGAAPTSPGAAFDRLAGVYDLQLPLERRALRRAAALAGSIEGARVLDLGAGTGALAAALARRGRPREIVLVDSSPKMLAAARRRLRRRGLSRVTRTVIADAREPEVEGPFDLVGVSYLLHLLPAADAARVVASARALLAPGGRLVVVSHSSPAGCAGGIYRSLWRLLARRLPPALAAGPLADVRPLLRAAGFRVDAGGTVPGVYWTQVVLARPSAVPGPAP